MPDRNSKNTPNRSNVVGLLFYQCFPIRNQEPLGSPLKSADPKILYVIPMGF